MSVGLVKNLSACATLELRIISAPSVNKTENKENNIKFRIKLRLPIFNSFLSFAYLE